MNKHNTRTVLVTGGAGYIGSGVVAGLLNDEHRVVCVDSLEFGGEALLAHWTHPSFEFRRCDIRSVDAIETILVETQPDAVIHLAAIVGDPACSQDPERAHAVNWIASCSLADACRRHGVERFIFASTCSNYGKMKESGVMMTEMSELAPVSLYAELKVQFERYLLEQMPHAASFAPTCLRFATVYGLASRMRFDLTVNEFARDAALAREIVVFGEQFWRPYCHVSDFYRAFAAVINAPAEQVSHEVFNVGDTAENYTKAMLIDVIRAQVPDLRVSFVPRTEDPRDYRVDCDKIHAVLGFDVSVRVPAGIAEIIAAVRAGVFADPDAPRYSNSAIQ